jgi:flagellar FliL protein
MEDQNPAENQQTEAKGGSKKWLFISLGLVVLLGGAGGAYFFLGFSAEAEAIEEEPSVAELSEINDVFPLEPLVVNLADDEIRYARIGVSLGLVSAKPGEVIIDEKLMIPKLRDRFLVLVGQKTSSDLASTEVKENLKKAIADFINEGLDPKLGRVSEVYFTEFIIQ